MNSAEILRIVDAIHRDKRIDKEIVFSGVEAAIATAFKKQHGEEANVSIHIDRSTGIISGTCDDKQITPEDMERIGAQSAKQVMIQKIREAEQDSVYNEYHSQLGNMVVGSVIKNEGGTTTVNIGSMEAILPRGEKIPGESYRLNDRIHAVLVEVKKSPNRVKVILSRVRTQLIQKLFEQEIPEIADGVICIKGVSREPGHRAKIAVHCTDQRIDAVRACIGMRGNRIKVVTDELAGERIDVIRWSDDLQEYIPNALQPAKIDEVILCTMLGRAVVLVDPDQRSLAIGRKGQNVRLASKLVGWDVEIWTRDELESTLERVMGGYLSIEGIDSDLADKLVGEGFLSFDDLSIIEPNDLMQMGDLSEEVANAIIEKAEELALEEERQGHISHETDDSQEED